VAIFVQWVRHVDTKSPKRVLWLNIDETSIGLAPPHTRGLVVSKQLWRLAPGGCVSEPATVVKKEDLRGAFTYMAVICSCQLLQQELPHMLIGCEAKLTRKLMKSMEDLPPSKLQLVRQKSAWCNAANLVDYFKKLQVALAPYVEILRPVVVLDVAPSHLPEAVMRGAQECGLELVYVPAGTTSIAQPLDVYGFRSFKSWLARELQLLRPSIPARSPISTKDLLGILRRAPTDFFCRRHWDTAFRCLGVGPPHTWHTRLRRALPVDFVGVSGKLTVQQLEEIFPKKRRMEHAPELLL